MAPASPFHPAQVDPPTFTLSDAPLATLAPLGVLAVPTLPGPEGPRLDAAGEELSTALGVDLLEFLALAGASGRAGEVISVAAELAERPVVVLAVGLGQARPADYRRAGAATARALTGRAGAASAITAAAPDAGLEAFVVGATLGSFRFDWRADGPAERPAGEIVLAGSSPQAAAVLDRAVTLGAAGWLARRLATTPSNLKSPAWLAGEAERIAEADDRLSVEVWDERDLARHGMGGILGVGQASATPSRLIRLDYTPRRGRRAPHVVLVGKGITFDSGGLSIKPAEAMSTMKRDMTGGGVVMAVLGALSAFGCGVRVTGLVASAENAVGGNALRPGDVVTHYGGRTSEVTNTDAEGRLVMADALAWAVDRLKPDAIVDIATLTGAMKVALGPGIGGVFATDDALAAALSAAGDQAGEPLWRMPLVQDYQDRLRSRVADADNSPGGPGAITAALFLQHFTGGRPWAHLDVASAGDSTKDDFEWTQGPTGFGVRALLQWLGSEEPLSGVG